MEIVNEIYWTLGSSSRRNMIIRSGDLLGRVSLKRNHLSTRCIVYFGLLCHLQELDPTVDHRTFFKLLSSAENYFSICNSL